MAPYLLWCDRECHLVVKYDYEGTYPMTILLWAFPGTWIPYGEGLNTLINMLVEKLSLPRFKIWVKETSGTLPAWVFQYFQSFAHNRRERWDGRKWVHQREVPIWSIREDWTKWRISVPQNLTWGMCVGRELALCVENQSEWRKITHFMMFTSECRHIYGKWRILRKG